MSDYINKSAVIRRLKQLQGSDTLANMFVSDVIKEVKNQPTISETEIIRKCGKQIIEKMIVLLDLVNPNQRLSVMQAMDIVKEECGISE